MYDLKIFTDLVEPEAVNQIYNLVKLPAFQDCKVRIMPDVHAGAGCVIGFTANLGDKVIPNIVGVDIGCLDKDSEYLTPTGWKKMNEYNEKDFVLGFDPVTNKADFVKPLAYVVKPCEKFFHYKNKKGLDQMVSEEHKMLVYIGCKNRGYKYLDMKPNELNTRSLKKGYYNFETVFERQNDSLLMTDNQIRLAIMISADGRIRPSDYALNLELHFKKARKIKRAQELLKLEDIPYSTTVIQDGSTMIYATVDKMYNKDLTFLYKGNSRQLRIAAEESLKWDGYEGFRNFYITTNKKNADAIQYAFHASGIRAGISVSNYKNPNWKESYIVTPTKNSKVGYNKYPILEPSIDGKKYCFTMPQGYFVARRNGKIFLTGNCGMLVCPLGKIDIDYAILDKVIRDKVPYGKNVGNVSYNETNRLIQELYCINRLKNLARLKESVGSLGGGNHFIEIDVDNEGCKYLIIHSGSRNLGKQVADIYQDIAIEYCHSQAKARAELIEKLTMEGKQRDIQTELQKLKAQHPSIPNELCYLEMDERENYLHDMKLCQNFAIANRFKIAEKIFSGMKWNHHVLNDRWESVHNYIDENNMVRKGAISAKNGQKVIIPMNMRDGCIIGIGKGNEDWNYSAPHGAGRIMSRSKAKEVLNMQEFEESMRGIFTTSVNSATVDEAPMAYKPMESILENIKETVDVVDIIKPVYNFKASE